MKNIVNLYLELSKYSNLKNSFENFFLSHPNYPSLYAITDSLTLLGVENIAARVDKEQFFDLPLTFLALYSEELVLVERFDKGVYISKEKSKRDLISIDDFINNWNGIVLAIEENKSEEKINKTNEISNYFFLFTGLLVVYFFSNYQNLGLINTIGFILSLIGFLIGVFVIKEKYGSTEDTLVTKFCSFSENASCSSVIKSSKTSILKWIDFSDLPIIFFASSVISQLLNQQYISIICFMSVLSLPVVGYSIWLQKVDIKKWCALCLAVSVILLLLSIIYMVSSNYYLSKSIFHFFVIGSIVISIWYFIKYYIENNSRLNKENIELTKFKRNSTVFNSLLKPVSNYNVISSFNKIVIGEMEAPINLTLLLSPSCGHCHTAYKEALELHKKFQDKISIIVLFNVNPNNQLNNYLEIVLTMLYINRNSSEEIFEALNDWHIKRMNLESWLAKWNKAIPDFENEKFDLEQQYNWCQGNNFNFTPVKLINDNIYPIEYSIDEIKYFISEFEEIHEMV